jgi:putative FmdB family regulatory protein
MPIYAYKCESCGFAKDVLQRMSDALLTDCPSCGAPEFKKQLTAAGFQLKGTGWYATDFKGAAATSAPASGSDAAPQPTSDAKPAETSAAPAVSPAPTSTPAASGS